MSNARRGRGCSYERMRHGPAPLEEALAIARFLREDTLMAQPVDRGRLELTGEAVPTPAEIQISSEGLGLGAFSVSANGQLVYQSGSTEGSQLIWFDRTGKQIGVLGDPAAYEDLELSPDGKRASVTQAGKGRDIWVYDVARDLRTRFTFDPADEWGSSWSPDGSRIVFNSNRRGHFYLFQKASSGAGTEEVLLEDNLDKFFPSW